jgi:hypothetical protein
MNKQLPLIVIVLVGLAGLALYLGVQAAHRGESIAVIVMLVIAMIFWKRAQRLR